MEFSVPKSVLSNVGHPYNEISKIIITWLIELLSIIPPSLLTQLR